MIILCEKVVAYLTINAIKYSAEDYITGQPEGQPDQIIYWNTEKLGAEPTAAQLDEAYPIYEGQQISAQNKATASQLLSETDWTTIPDVSNPNISNPYLINASEFAAYRSQIRFIAVNPPTTPAVFPEKPDEQWGN